MTLNDNCKNIKFMLVLTIRNLNLKYIQLGMLLMLILLYIM